MFLYFFIFYIVGNNQNRQKTIKQFFIFLNLLFKGNFDCFIQDSFLNFSFCDRGPNNYFSFEAFRLFLCDSNVARNCWICLCVMKILCVPTFCISKNIFLIKLILLILSWYICIYSQYLTYWRHICQFLYQQNCRNL